MEDHQYHDYSDEDRTEMRHRIADLELVFSMGRTA